MADRPRLPGGGRPSAAASNPRAATRRAIAAAALDPVSVSEPEVRSICTGGVCMSCISGPRDLGSGTGRAAGGESDLGPGCGARASGGVACELSGMLTALGLDTTEKPAVVPVASDAKDEGTGPAGGEGLLPQQYSRQ